MTNKSTKAMKSIKKVIFTIISICIAAFAIFSIVSGYSIDDFRNLFTEPVETGEETVSVIEGNEYSTYKEVAEYIHLYKELPPNYMTKKQASSKGWDGGNPQNDIGGNVYIGGDKFSNLEKLLPTDKKYYECDVDYLDNSRGERRLIFTKDGKVYYTDDHYKSFIELY